MFESRSPKAHGLIPVVALLAGILVIHPVAEMGINDDWSYIRTAQVLAQTGHIVYNGWATAMLGWQVLLGAFFIKLFGFSFTVTRASTLVVSLPGTWLLQRTLVRFGLTSSNAVFGTLLIVTSPLFLPLAFTFMSDLLGFFCIVLCLYCCQRALQAIEDRTALAWLCVAGITNMAGGTVRQIAWLGVLVMVPSTAWMMRRRRGALLAGALLWIAGLLSIYACVHWFLRQPYSIPEESVVRMVDRHTFLRLLHSLRDIFFSIFLFTCPALIAFLPHLSDLPRDRSRTGWTFVCASTGTGAIAGALSILIGHPMGSMLLPWLGNVVTPVGILKYSNLVGAEPIVLSLWVRLMLTVVVLLSSVGFLTFLRLDWPAFRADPLRHKPLIGALSWNQVAGLLLPFSFAYLGLLLPRAAFRVVVDRYLPPLILAAAIFALRYLQERVVSREYESGRRLLAVFLASVCLLALALYGIAGAHDVYALGRARVVAAAELRGFGVPKTSFDGGMEYDGWTQIEAWGYIDDPHLVNPSGAYRPEPVNGDPCRNWFLFMTPAIQPKFVFSNDASSCYVPSDFPSVPYATWLPPYSQRVYIQRVP